MKRGLVFIVLLLFLVSFSFVLAENETNNSDEIIIGEGCGVVSPDSRDECCQNSGYDKWDEDDLECEKEDDDETEIEVEVEIEEDDDDDENETEEEYEEEIEVEFNGYKYKIKEKYKHTIQTQNRLKYNSSAECPERCECSGSTMKCEFESERRMIIHAGKSGNTIIQVKGVNASTKVELFKENESVYGLFKEGEPKPIVLPDHVMERIRERIQNHTGNSSLELDEDGKYRYEIRKQAKLFGFIKVKEKVKVKVNSETGEIERVRNSWWGFLARDFVDEVEQEVEVEEIVNETNQTQ